MTKCKHCGAVLSSTKGLGRLDAIPGLEYAKRATEVALVGGHSITFVCDPETLEYGKALANWAQEHGATARVITPCPCPPCGNYGSSRHCCRCSASTVKRHRARAPYRAALQADQVLVLQPPRVEQVLSTRPREADEVVLERVAWARQLPDPERTLDPTGRQLLRVAQREGWLPGRRTEQVMAVAASIARLHGEDPWSDRPRIEPAGLAEALQYVSLPGTWD